MPPDAGTSRRQKRALIIGVNSYPNLAPRSQLKGCVNDAHLMAAVLRDVFAFPISDPTRCTILLDEQATRAAIIGALDNLANSVKQNDLVVVHYSGHGSQMRDLENDEAMGWDETIVPSDTGRKLGQNRDITDDEIYTYLARLTAATPFITLIFDCCHSGTITRDAFGAPARLLERDERSPAELRSQGVQRGSLLKAGDKRGASRWLPLSDRYVLIAGCRDDERSYEHNFAPDAQDAQSAQPLMHGTLTYVLCQELLRTQLKAQSTYRDVFEHVSAQVTSIKPRQHPQIEGVIDRAVFGLQEITPLRFVSVTARADSKLTLAAGAAHGLTVGSRWGVYPPASKQAPSPLHTETVTGQAPSPLHTETVTGQAPPQTRLGEVRITAVQAVEAEATILGERSAGAILALARAVEEERAHSDRRLLVDIVAPSGMDTLYGLAVAALRQLIERSGLLRLAAAAESAEMRAYIIPPRSDVQPEDPVPQIGARTAAVWAVVGEDGRLAMPLHLLTEPNADLIVRDNLEKIVRYRNTLRLTNVDPKSKLKGKVDVVLKRQSDDDWVAAVPEPGKQHVVFVAGERIGVAIANRHSAPVYVSLLDFGLTGKIGLLHPIKAASEKLAAGQTLEIGTRVNDVVRLRLPANWPYSPDPGDGEAKEGLETFKLIATSHEADFWVLLQEGLREMPAATGQGTPAHRLLANALAGLGERVRQVFGGDPAQDWTTVERSFILKRA